MIKLKQLLKDIHLDYVNHFLTIKWFAEYYQIEEEDAKTLINITKKYNQ